MEYRMHIDMPVGMDKEEAVKKSRYILGVIENNLGTIRAHGVESVNFRLGNDADRQKSNYLDVNENGHCSNKKSKIVL
tara:strand:- start:47944 stop:48177 length:234 start_codon:yes stop_codon:yes gene_type:complete